MKRRGWAGEKNGDLLALARGEFDAFLTIDRGIEHQQNLEELYLVVIVLRARSNRLRDTAPLVDEVKAVLSASLGVLVRVPEGGTRGA